MTFGILALIIAAGLAGPALSALAPGAIPVVIGEIGAGVAIGVTGTGWLDPTEPTVAFLSRMGFATLMFVAGTHVPLRSAALRPAFGRGAAAAVVTAVLAVPCAIAIAAVTGIHHPALLALPMATTSAAIALPLLAERGLGDGALVAVAWATIADVATIITVPLALAPDRAARVTAGSVLVTGVSVALWLAARATRGTARIKALRRLSKRFEWALDLRLSLLALAILAAIADRAGTSILVAGFSAGLVVGGIGEPRRLTRQIRGVGQGFLIPVFFVVLGARLDLTGLLQSGQTIGLALALTAASTVIHVLGARAVRQPVAVGLVATAALGVPAAVVELGLTGGQIDGGQGAAIIAAALASIGVCALGSSRIRMPGKPAVPAAPPPVPAVPAAVPPES